MADELDPTLAARLRDALHAEADGLGVTVRAAELRRAAAERRRASGSQRLGLLAAAASILVVLGGGALVASARPDGSVAASPSAGVSRQLASTAALLALVGPDATPMLEGEHVGAGAAAATPVSVPLGTLGGGEGGVFVLDCAGGAVDVVFVGLDFATDSHTARLACGSGPGGVVTAEVAGTADVTVVADAATSWRIVFARAPGPSAPVEPSATPFVLASFAELEAIVAQNGIGEAVIGKAEQTEPVPGDGRTGTTIAELPAYQFLDVFISCTGGSYAIDVLEAGPRPSDPPDRIFGFGSTCGEHPLVITDGISSERPVSVVIRTTGPVVWRVVVGGWPAQREVGSAPPGGG